MMRFKCIVLLLLLVLPIIAADIDTSMRNNNSISIEDQHALFKSRRIKRQCGCSTQRPSLIVCCKGVTGQKEMFKNWWLPILLLLLPKSLSWMKAMLC
ncbi:Thyroid adenoma-associated protein [Dirofilaria immitis]